MEKQHKLVVEILRRLSKEAILDRVLLIGSWCASFYKHYLSGVDYTPVLRTRDIDFLVPLRARFPRTIDIAELFADLGFETDEHLTRNEQQRVRKALEANGRHIVFKNAK